MLKVFCVFLLIANVSLSSTETIKDVERFEIQNHVGNQIEFKNLTFVDESGSAVELSRYFNGKPVVLSLIYYKCPDICGLVLNGMLETFRDSSLIPGQDFTVLSISIDPKEKSELAKAKKEAVVKQLQESKPAADWHFLTGTEPVIRYLADQVGFTYKFIEETGLYSHAPGIFILDPRGSIGASLKGVMYPFDVFDPVLVSVGSRSIGSIGQKFSVEWKTFDFEKQNLVYDFKKVVTSVAIIGLMVMVGLFMLLKLQGKKNE